MMPKTYVFIVTWQLVCLPNYISSINIICGSLTWPEIKKRQEKEMNWYCI